MFERRLKLFLGIVLGVMSILLLRAFHLQVITRNQWRQQAEDFNKRPAYIETTRGRILDHKDNPIAVDEACTDACVDYRAISRDQVWLEEVAAKRLRDRLGTDYTKAAKDVRKKMVEEEVPAVKADIDRMWVVLAQESDQTLEQIEDICHTIELKIAMRIRRAQYRRFEAAGVEREENEPSWYRRWLIEGGNGGPKVDDFAQVYGDQLDAHPVVRDISADTYIRLAKASDHLPGLILRAGTTRNYRYGKAGAHLIGALSPVTEKDFGSATLKLLKDDLRGYDFADVIGRGGLEGLAEPTLRGSRGKMLRQAGKPDELLTAPVPGRDIRCTIDIEMQGEIQQLFANMQVPSNKPDDKTIIPVAMHGAAVVIDIKTGQVRALASYPDYDVNTLAEHYDELLEQKRDVPLLNRATQAQLEPGSTIKPAVGIAAITQGLNVRGVGPMTTHTGIECTGYLVINGRRIHTGGRCWVATRFENILPSVSHHPIPVAHKGSYGNPDGSLVFADALERSCNVYFETLGDALGIDGLSYWYDRLGLGHETGLGISEACGFLPNNLKSTRMSTPWFCAIGQEMRVTPIQMANIAATIARDGEWVRPTLIETADATLSPVPMRGGRVLPDRQDLKLSKEALAAAREGMIRVVQGESGTGKQAHINGIQIAGKTGTAQAAKQTEDVLNPDGTPQRDAKGNKIKRELPLATADQTTATPWYRGWGKDGTSVNHAWFIGFAPANDPQVAFSVMIEYGGSGGFAAEVSTKILEKCIEHGYVKLRRP